MNHKGENQHCIKNENNRKQFTRIRIVKRRNKSKIPKNDESIINWLNFYKPGLNSKKCRDLTYEV